jgi:tetratricopeptide (TPR) repeat protein
MQQLDQALVFYRDAAAVRRRLVDAEPHASEFRRALANTIMNIGLLEKERHRFSEARRQMEQAQSLRLAGAGKAGANGKLRRDTAMGYFNLSNAELAARDDAASRQDQSAADRHLADAIGFLEKAIVRFREVHAESPRELSVQWQLATCCNVLADLKRFTAATNAADLTQAVALYDEARGLAESLAARNPDVPQYQVLRASLHLSLGEAHTADARLDDALASYQTARGILEKLSAEHAAAPRYERDLAMALSAIGSVQAELGQWQRARESLTDSLARLERLVKRHPENAEFVALRDNGQDLLRMLDELQRQESPPQ